MPDPAAEVDRRAGWSGWRTVLWLGVVSLLVDLVYEGARSITGPVPRVPGRVGADGRAGHGRRRGRGARVPPLLRTRRRPVRPLLAVDGRRLRPDRGLRAVDGAGTRARCRRSGVRRRDGAARAHRQGDPEPGEVRAARGRGRATSAAAVASACTRRSTRRARSSGPCSWPASSRSPPTSRPGCWSWPCPGPSRSAYSRGCIGTSATPGTRRRPPTLAWSDCRGRSTSTPWPAP